MNKEIPTELYYQPLLQHGELSAAHAITNPGNLSVPLLQRWLSFARDICDRQGFQCLAFTELPQATQNILGFSDTLPPRIIYYRTDISNKGLLIINPTIYIDYPNNPYIPIFEACGSIDHGKLWYFIKRPSNRTVHGLIYNDNFKSLKVSTIQPIDPFTDLSIHEADHLGGKTALSFPEHICDLQDPNTWSLLLEWYPDYSLQKLKGILSEVSPKGLLSYDHKQHNFTVVDVNGESLRNYNSKNQ